MTRILITAAAGGVLSGVIGYFLIPILRTLKAGQSIREVGPTWHNNKAGTPMITVNFPSLMLRSRFSSTGASELGYV